MASDRPISDVRFCCVCGAPIEACWPPLCGKCAAPRDTDGPRKWTALDAEGKEAT